MSLTGVYILLCKNNTFYVGSTNNLDRRLSDHQNGRSTYTKKLRPVSLVKFIPYESPTQAKKLEYAIKKKKSRKYIEGLIAGTINI